MTDLYLELQDQGCYDQLWDYCLIHDVCLSSYIIIGNHSPRGYDYSIHSCSGDLSRCGYEDFNRSVTNLDPYSKISVWSGSGSNDFSWIKSSIGYCTVGSSSGSKYYG